MQGIIFEVNKNKAVALDSEGRFVNLKNRGYVVGEKLEIDKAQRPARSVFMRLATAFVLVLTLAATGIFGGLFYADNFAASYTVQMDINPSVTLYVNAKDIVIKAVGNNDDGKGLNPNVLRGNKIDDYIVSYLDLCAEKGFISAEKDNAVTISVDGKKADTNTSALSARIENAVRREFNKLDIPVTTETENGITAPGPGDPDGGGRQTANVSFVSHITDDGRTVVYYRSVNQPLGERPEYPKDNPVREGYDFLGWSKSADISYTSFEGTNTEHHTLSGDMTLYAVWKPTK
ncbi:hypothetical protein FACS1894211_06440 [Clostridia bacterium]|nr:hypothetical protein FACS1894211_06440 [Clostridia bacterium]